MQTAGKFNNGQKFKSIVRSSRVSTYKGKTENCPMSEDVLGTKNIYIASKSLFQFSFLFYVKQTTDVNQLVTAKMNQKKKINYTCLLYNIQKSKGYSKINESVNQAQYCYIIQHPQVMPSLISNVYVKVSAYDHTYFSPEIFL